MRGSFVSNTDSEPAVYENIDNIQKRLYDEVLLSLEDSAQMDIKEQEIRDGIEKENMKLQHQLDKAERDLVDIMKGYVEAEDDV